MTDDIVEQILKHLFTNGAGQTKSQLRAVDNNQPHACDGFELRGWIQPINVTEDDARKELESLGVQVGAWDTVIEEFKGCIVSRQALTNLDPYWGRYFWGLQP